MIKLVAIDMDGTLLDDKKQISQENIDTLKEYKKKGIKIVICTGRSDDSVFPYIASLKVKGIRDYFVLFNGSKVIDDEQNVISEEYISGKDYKELAKLAKKYNVGIQGFKNYGRFCEEIKPAFTKNITKENLNAHIEPLEKTKDDEKIIKAAFTDSIDKIDFIEKKIPKRFYEEFSVTRIEGIFIDVVVKGVNKWHGLVQLANYLNIKETEIMTIGDENNDIEMLKNAKVSVAMENASKEIKNVAKYITKTNNESGVALAIKKYCV